MANLNAPQIQDPNTRFLRPVSPVQDNSVANAITSVGELAFTVDKQIRKNSLQNDLEGLSQDVTQSSPEEAASQTKEISNFQAKINKLKNAISSGSGESAVKVRAESILKEHIARAPGYAADFRAVAAGVLGFDPTGSALAKTFSDTKAAEKQMLLLQKQLTKLSGNSNLDINTPEGVAYFENASAIVQETENNKRTIALAESQDKLDTINLPDKLATAGTSGFINTRSQVDNLIMEATGKRLTELTDADIRNIDDIAGLKFKIAQLGVDNNAILQGTFGGKTGISEININEAGQQTTDFLDLVNSRLDKKASLEEVQNNYQYITAITQQKMLNNPDLKQYTLFKKLFPNTPLPDKVTLKMFRVFGELAKGISTNPIPNGNKTKEQKLSMEQGYKGLFKSIADSPTLTNEQQVSASKLVKGFSNGAIRNFNDLEQTDKDSLIEVLQDKNVAKAISNLPNSSEEGVKLRNVAESYTMQVMNNTIGNIKGELDFKISGEVTVGNNIVISRSDKGFIVRPKDSSVNAEKVANFVRNAWLKRLNKSITAISNFDGATFTQSLESLARVHSSKDPLVNFFINGTEESK